MALGVHPTSRGFGWIAFESPSNPYDWGIFAPEADKNARCLRKVEKLVERLKPETVILEAFDKRSSIRSERIRRLCTSIAVLANDQGVEVAVFSRGDIRACFASVGAKTRHEIAEAVARHIQAIRPRLPRKRRCWEGEDRRLSLFCAAALVLTYFHYGATRIFENLEDAA